LQRRIARLHREAEELKAEVLKQKAERSRDDHDVEQALDTDTINQLGNALKNIENIDTETTANAQLRLAQRLRAPLNFFPSAPNGVASVTSTTNGAAYTISYAPSYTTGHTLNKVVDFDVRLNLLEAAVGINSLPLPSQEPTPPKAILPTLDTLDRQVSFLSSTTPVSLESMSKKIRQLTLEIERLNEARKSAKASLEALKPDKGKSHPPITDEGSRDSIHDPEQASKINALYGAIPTIESMAPILPSVLDRLRSLRLIHADAASASQSLAAVEKRQVEMAEEIRSWREGLEKVEGVMKDGETRMKENMAVVEGWVKEVEKRLQKLEV
jgi:nuclear migration protein JNM1